MSVIDFLLDQDSDRSNEAQSSISVTMKANIANAKSQIAESRGNAEKQPFVIDCDAGDHKMTCTYEYHPV